jgi:hypothetical protein
MRKEGISLPEGLELLLPDEKHAVNGGGTRGVVNYTGSGGLSLDGRAVVNRCPKVVTNILTA